MPSTQADWDRLGAWARMYDDDLDIDRSKGQGRTVPVEVLHFAFPRTGSLSMVEAYQILGFTCPYHYSNIFSNVRDCDMWMKMLRAKKRGERVPKKDFDLLLGHCSVLSDAPVIKFWRELLDAYPGAKVVLVGRDEQKWLKSFEGVLQGVLDPVARYILRFIDPFIFGRVITVGGLWVEGLVGSSQYEQARSNAIPVMRKHYADVRAAVPAERLLNYELGSGWAPLCEFLDKPIPSVAFPHRNEAKALKDSFTEFGSKTFKKIGLRILVVVAPVVAATVYWRWVR